MDGISIAAALNAVALTKQAISAAIGIRDFNAAATELAKLNDALLAAQNALLTQNELLFNLQREKFEATEKLRKLEETIAEKSRYSLFEISKGNFVMRLNVAPDQGGAGEPGSAEPMHYLCQPCFGKGTSSVLQRVADLYGVYAKCTICQAKISTGEQPPPLPRLVHRPEFG